MWLYGIFVTYMLNVSVIQNNIFLVMVFFVTVCFYAIIRGSQCDEYYIDRKVLIFFKNRQLFLVILRIIFHFWSHLNSWFWLFQIKTCFQRTYYYTSKLSTCHYTSKLRTCHYTSQLSTCNYTSKLSTCHYTSKLCTCHYTSKLRTCHYTSKLSN